MSWGQCHVTLLFVKGQKFCYSYFELRVRFTCIKIDLFKNLPQVGSQFSSVHLCMFISKLCGQESPLMVILNFMLLNSLTLEFTQLPCVRGLYILGELLNSCSNVYLYFKVISSSLSCFPVQEFPG